MPPADCGELRFQSTAPQSIAKEPPEKTPSPPSESTGIAFSVVYRPSQGKKWNRLSVMRGFTTLYVVLGAMSCEDRHGASESGCGGISWCLWRGWNRLIDCATATISSWGCWQLGMVEYYGELCGGVRTINIALIKSPPFVNWKVSSVRHETAREERQTGRRGKSSTLLPVCVVMKIDGSSACWQESDTAKMRWRWAWLGETRRFLSNLQPVYLNDSQRVKRSLCCYHREGINFV